MRNAYTVLGGNLVEGLYFMGFQTTETRETGQGT
jgi:hypothetical protein